MQRQKVRDRAERRPTEEQNEPKKKEDERDDEEPRARGERGDDSRAEERGEQGESTVVEQVPGHEPTHDGRRAEGVVLRAVEVRADVEIAGLSEERDPHVRADQTGESADGPETQDAAERVRARQSEQEEHDRGDRGHVRVDEMRERERRAHQSGDDDTAAASGDAMQGGEREKREVHAEDLRVHAKAAPHVAVVLEAVAVVPRDERSRGRSDR